MNSPMNSPIKKETELVINALSVGWHLCKIKEIDPTIFTKEEEFKRLLKWLDRHEINGNNYENTIR